MNSIKKLFLKFRKPTPQLISQLARANDVTGLNYILQNSGYKRRISFLKIIGDSGSEHTTDLLFHFLNDPVRIVSREVISLLSVKSLSEFQRKQILAKEKFLDKADENEKNWPKGKPKMGYNMLKPGYKQTPSERMNEMYNIQVDMNSPSLVTGS